MAADCTNIFDQLQGFDEEAPEAPEVGDELTDEYKDFLQSAIDEIEDVDIETDDVQEGSTPSSSSPRRSSTPTPGPRSSRRSRRRDRTAGHRLRQRAGADRRLRPKNPPAPVPGRVASLGKVSERDRPEHRGEDDAVDTVLITARGLVKRFGDLTAVDGIDVDVRRGEAFGFLGPNGAGKSSTMRMIGCTSPATAGTLRVLGLDPATHGRDIRARLGVVPQQDQLDGELTVAENLVIYGRYFDIPRAECKRRAAELLDFVQLGERADSKVEPLSGGMKRRVTIARSLINEPELLLLDEPTTGLDPQARHVLWDRLYRLKQQGVTLVLTTHYMDEAEQLCDRLVVMDKGAIVAMGSPRELIDRYSTREVLELRFPAGTNEAQAAALHNVGERAEILPDRVFIYTDDGEVALKEVHNRGVAPESALVRRSSLEDVFLRLTGRSLVD